MQSQTSFPIPGDNLMKKYVAIAVACLMASTAPPTTAREPLFEQQDQRYFLPPQPSTPVRDYDIQFVGDFDWPGDQWVTDRIAQRVFPERVLIKNIDAEARKLHVQATRYGMETLASSDMKITPTGPDVPEPECSSVFADVALSKEAKASLERPNVRGGAVCPFATEIYPHRNLLVEGLDRKGKRLFVALSDDARWSVSETITPEGNLKLDHMGRDAPSSTYVQFRAVIDAHLRKLRVWEIGEDGQAKALGDVEWRDVEAIP